jgi:hypothetical protein
MQKAILTVSMIALVITLGFGAANAQQARRGYYGPQQGGWNCSWMGGSGGSGWTGRSGYNSPWGGNWQGQGWGMGPGSYHGRGTSGQYGAQQPVRR